MAHLGRRIWVFPDTELPPPGDSALKGHESIIVLNLSKRPVQVTLTLYYTDRAPQVLSPIDVAAERVRCIRLDHESDVGVRVPLETQYAVKLDATGPVVAQYGRLDSRQVNLAYYTTMGFAP